MRRIPWFLRLLFGGALLVVLLRRYPVSWDELGRTFASVNWLILAGTLVLLLNQFVFSSIKWQAILRSHDIRMRLPRLVRTYMIGNFFSAFLPSSYGGDVVRIADVARASGRTFESAAAVVLERLSGLAALTAVGAVASAWVAHRLGIPDFRTLAVILAVILFLLVAVFIPGLLGLAGRLVALVPVGAVRRTFGRIEAVVVHYRSRPGLLLVLLALSFAFQITAYTIFHLYGRALRIDIPWSYCLAFVPVIYILEALPISVAGIGLREGGLIYFLGRLGLSSADALSLSILVVSGRYACTALGGVLFLLQRGSRTTPAVAPAEPAAGGAPAHDPGGPSEDMRSGLQRRVRRLLRNVTPGFVGTLYYYRKFRCVIHPNAMVQISSRIRVGRKTTVHRFARIILSDGEVRLGSRCNVQVFTTIAAGDSVIRIGDDVRIGPNCNLVGENHVFSDRDTPIHLQPNDPKGLVIGDDVWIGANSVVLPGVEIGRGCVVGAGSVVTKSLPPYSVAVGNPARVVRSR